MQHLRERWVDMYHVAQLSDSSIETHQTTYLLYQVGSVSTISMTPHYAVVNIRQQFQQAFGSIHRQSLAVGTPECFATTVARQCGFTLIFRQTHTGSFRTCEDGR